LICCVAILSGSVWIPEGLEIDIVDREQNLKPCIELASSADVVQNVGSWLDGCLGKYHRTGHSASLGFQKAAVYVQVLHLFRLLRGLRYQSHRVEYGSRTPFVPRQSKSLLDGVPFMFLYATSMHFYSSSSSSSSSAPFSNTSDSCLSKSSACCFLKALIRSAGPVGLVIKSAI